MDELANSIRVIYNTCFLLASDESVLILIDPNYREMGERFLQEAKKVTSAEVALLEIPEGKVNGEEPPLPAADKMWSYHIIIMLTKKSLTHTRARKEASRRGARIASMPSVTEDMMRRCIDVNYDEMNLLSNWIADILDTGSTMRLVKDDGTDLSFSIKGRKAHGRHGGLFRKDGEYGNLPDGEAFIAPLEGTSNGVFIIDGSIAREGLVDMPVNVVVKDGLAVEMIGGKAADALRSTLESAGSLAFNIAEFGIGTNPKAIITGNMLEDEKVMGTVHIAFGNSTGFGGEVDVPVHIDCLIRNPTVYVDSKPIMENGEFCF